MLCFRSVLPCLRSIPRARAWTKSDQREGAPAKLRRSGHALPAVRRLKIDEGSVGDDACRVDLRVGTVVVVLDLLHVHRLSDAVGLIAARARHSERPAQAMPTPSNVQIAHVGPHVRVICYAGSVGFEMLQHTAKNTPYDGEHSAHRCNTRTHAPQSTPHLQHTWHTALAWLPVASGMDRHETHRSEPGS